MEECLESDKDGKETVKLDLCILGHEFKKLSKPRRQVSERFVEN